MCLRHVSLSIQIISQYTGSLSQVTLYCNTIIYIVIHCGYFEKNLYLAIQSAYFNMVVAPLRLNCIMIQSPCCNTIHCNTV